MELSDQDMLRRALMAIVNRIESGGSTPVMIAQQPGHSSDAISGPQTTEPPIVLIVLGQSGSTNGQLKEGGEKIQEPRAAISENHDKSFNSVRSDMSYPGFEKFQNLEPRPSSAPKFCFMEPDRVCVNSGACEMLGH